MKSKIYINNNSFIQFGDTRFTRDKNLSCKEATIRFKDCGIDIEVGSQKVHCDVEDLGLDEDDCGFFYEIDL